MGAAATAVIIPARALDWPDFVQGLAFGVLLVSVVMLLRRRLRDEYIDGLWNSGTTFAFVALLFWYILAPFTHGFFEGLLDLEPAESLPVDWTGLVALAAFFVGFHYKWLAEGR
jgi:glucan phosphoethanolaminetransferase (alkaline phosphatase superfamily)